MSQTEKRSFSSSKLARTPGSVAVNAEAELIENMVITEATPTLTEIIPTSLLLLGHFCSHIVVTGE
jgi:hypothetical protein